MCANYAAPEQVSKRSLAPTTSTVMWVAGLKLYTLVMGVKNVDRLAWFRAVADSVAAGLDTSLTEVMIVKKSRFRRALLRSLLQPNGRKHLSAQRALHLGGLALRSSGLSRGHPFALIAFSGMVSACLLYA